MSTLGRQLSENDRQSFTRAIRTLLRHPLITASGPFADELSHVRRHARELREWFANQAGWRLHVETELARLSKPPPDALDGSRPARVRNGEPFTQRRYVLFCLALAALDRMDRQTTLQRIADRIVQLVAEEEEIRDAGVEFTLEGRAQRLDLVRVMRTLLDFQVIVRVQGDEESFVSGRGDVLYQIDRSVLTRLIDYPRPPSSVEAEDHDDRLEALLERAHIESDEARRQNLRHQLVRRLLDDPVVYYDTLTHEELDYIRRARGILVPQLEDATGLVAETRSEGIALADPRGDLTDIALPTEGTDSHVTLLVAEYLAEKMSRSPGTTISIEELRRHVAILAKVHGKHWRKDARAPGAESRLTAAAVERLAALRLVDTDGVVPRPAIARYALVPPGEAGRPTLRRSGIAKKKGRRAPRAASRRSRHGRS